MTENHETPVSFRACALSDKQQLRDIAEETYRDAFGAHNTQADMDEYVRNSFSLARMEEELKNPHSRFIYALQNGEVAGYIKLNFAPAQTELNDDTALEIERIYVLKHCQGQSIGQQLVNHAIQLAQAQRLQYIWLGVWEHNPRAIRFYQRNGFRRFSQHIFKIGQDEQLDYLMRKELAPPDSCQQE